MGTLVKRYLAMQWGLQPAQIYHCAVMPCYDKKLEASRADFNLPGAYCSLKSSSGMHSNSECMFNGCRVKLPRLDTRIGQKNVLRSTVTCVGD